MLIAFAALGLLALGAVIAVLALTSGGGGGGSSADVGAAMRAAGCTYETAAVKPLSPTATTQHVPSLDTKVSNWNTYPPAAGGHYPVPAIWGFYDDPVDPIRVVHNEEHGGVVLWWGPQTPAAEVTKLRNFYNESPESMVGSPIGTINGKSLGSKVAITAWTGEVNKYGESGDWGTGHVAVCPRFDEKAFKTFRDELRGEGPEGVAITQNQPGT